jgi:secreted Zn-dependent insulinase-like peptidase
MHLFNNDGSGSLTETLKATGWVSSLLCDLNDEISEIP